MSISAIIVTHRRRANVPIIVDRLRKQTIPPERIIVWNDYDEDKEDIKLEGVECINSTHNKWSHYPQFVMGYLCHTDYLAAIDDDKPPGPKWFEYCIAMMSKLPGVYGCLGYRIKDKGNLYSNLEYLEQKEMADNLPREVDMIGQSYFLKTEWLKYFFMEKPPMWQDTVDLHLAYTLQKYGGIKFYVLFPSNAEARAEYKVSELVYSEHERALYQQSFHRPNRTEYTRWAAQRGWR